MMDITPLQGVRVIDLTHAWAGPHASRVLADFGAEVIRVEYPKLLCLLRGGKKKDRAYDNQPSWFQINRNKYSITLDLKNESDRGILEDLVRVSDVFMENGRTGVMDSLGFGYSDLCRIKKDIIMVSMAGFGNSGPYAAFCGYGATFESVAGIQSLTAYDRHSRPYRIKELDTINGVSAAGAVLTALYHHRKSGEGQHVDFSHMEASTHALIGEHLLEYAMNATRSLPVGNRHPGYAPQGCYRCKGSDKWVTITVRTEDEWHGLCEAIGNSGLREDSRFADLSSRVANHDALDCLIEAWTKDLTHHEAMRILQGHGVPSGAVQDMPEISADLHLRERGYFLKGVEGSQSPFMGMPFKISGSGAVVRWRGPDLGRHNSEVVCRMLGRPEEDIRPIAEEDIGTAYDS